MHRYLPDGIMDDVNVSVVAYNSGTTVQCKHCWLSGSLLKKKMVCETHYGLGHY